MISMIRGFEVFGFYESPSRGFGPQAEAAFGAFGECLKSTVFRAGFGPTLEAHFDPF